MSFDHIFSFLKNTAPILIFKGKVVDFPGEILFYLSKDVYHLRNSSKQEFLFLRLSYLLLKEIKQYLICFLYYVLKLLTAKQTASYTKKIYISIHASKCIVYFNKTKW